MKTKLLYIIFVFMGTTLFSQTNKVYFSSNFGFIYNHGSRAKNDNYMTISTPDGLLNTNLT